MQTKKIAKKEIVEETIYLEKKSTENIKLDNASSSDSLKRLEKENRIISDNLSRLEEESLMLREMFSNANNELTNLKKPALLVAKIVSRIDEYKVIIKLPNGNKFYCYVSKEIGKIYSGDSVLVDQKTLNVVGQIHLDVNEEVEKFVIIDKPKENWEEIGGLEEEIREVKEVIELPLKKPELFREIGISPPKGILLHGPPGTGKTLLAKAVAHSTNATFIEVVGSELVQKFIGEGAKLVKEIFTLARKKSPAIVFIDEIDALAATRMDTGTSGEREVNRTFMQLLAELDGFKALDDVKIIGATNRLDILDNAIIRPGRLDRLIEIKLPKEDSRHEILKVHTKNMNLKRVNLKKISQETEGFSGAEIKGACTEAGFFAIREERNFITNQDFKLAIDKIQTVEMDQEEEKIFG